MNIQNAYNSWSSQYDTNQNKTRDLEAIILREMLADFDFESCLEIGCGTGKNTIWLVTKAKRVLAVDFSPGMLSIAKEKINSEKVNFVQADITEEWNFATRKFNLITFSLVLEHIENLEPIFSKAAASVKVNGIVYVGELHPYKQYIGSKARFENENGQQILNCFNHNLSDFVQCAKSNKLELLDLKEGFDENDKNTTPRILSLLFKKLQD